MDKTKKVNKEDLELDLLKKLIALLETREAKEANYVEHDGIAHWECPRCKNFIDMFYDGEQVNYCHFCGQKISF